MSANARQGALIDAGRALARWDAYRQAVKAGPPHSAVGCPRDKKRGLRPAFRADDGPATLRTDGKRLPLPAQMGGAVRRREALRGHGRITRVRIRQRAGHRYARMAADDGRPAPPVAVQGQPTLGVDRELKNQAVCRDGVVYAQPTPLDKRSLPQSVRTPLDPWHRDRQRFVRAAPEGGFGQRPLMDRASAADRLDDTGNPARGAIPRLAAALQDSSGWVRRNAVFSLGLLDDEEIGVRALGQCLTDSAPREAQNASLSLCKMSSQAQDAADALSQATPSDVKMSAPMRHSRYD